MADFDAAGFAKKHWLVIVSGAAGLYVLYTYLSNSGTTAAGGVGIVPAATVAPTSASVTPATPAPDDTALQLQLQYQLGQQQLAEQANVDSANAALAMENAQSTTALNEASAQTSFLTAEGTTAQAIGSAYAQGVTAQAQLPAATIAAGDQTAQAGLTAAGNIIAAGLTSVGGAIQGLGVGVGGVGQAASNTISSVATANAASNQNQGLNIGAAAFGISKLISVL